ncbi:MAG: dethiobiotin synthase [Hyphomicrobiales bacterium]
MSQTFIITGTDTNIGKTIFAAALTQALQATYWKPVQCGLEGETDSQIISRLTNCNVLEEAYRLSMPASPHLAAEAEALNIATDSLSLPAIDTPLVVEGAGGIMVPINREKLFLDLFVKWNAPVVLCARTTLGTINHTLLSVKALRDTGCEVLGVAFVGEACEAVEKTICDFGEVSRLGRLAHLDELTPETLKAAFNDGFDLNLFTQAPPIGGAMT